MSNPNYQNNPEAIFEEQAHAIIEHWKSQGITEVWNDPTRGTYQTYRHVSGIKFQIDDPKLLEYLARSISRGNKYNIN